VLSATSATRAGNEDVHELAVDGGAFQVVVVRDLVDRTVLTIERRSRAELCLECSGEGAVRMSG
jgi:hypothetical protein